MATSYARAAHALHTHQVTYRRLVGCYVACMAGVVICAGVSVAAAVAGFTHPQPVARIIAGVGTAAWVIFAAGEHIYTRALAAGQLGAFAARMHGTGHNAAVVRAFATGDVPRLNIDHPAAWEAAGRYATTMLRTHAVVVGICATAGLIGALAGWTTGYWWAGVPAGMGAVVCTGHITDVWGSAACHKEQVLSIRRAALRR